ncbi:hypothetical protein M405DRAFT_394419 [Rhizopogon salebrosus TDB-379]|nr:hypothetical protein M405DRAFT_394419 [Rhizopogon salebrosus TDB-379]
MTGSLSSVLSLDLMTNCHLLYWCRYVKRSCLFLAVLVLPCHTTSTTAKRHASHHTASSRERQRRRRNICPR